MRKFSRLITIILFCSMLLCSVSAAEHEEVSPYASAFFTATTTYLYEIDDNTFGVWFDVQGTYKMDTIGVSSIKIQRSRTGTSSWTTMKTFYPESYPQMLKSNSIYHGSSVTYTGTTGYYYRAYVTFYAEKDGNAGYHYSYASKMLL